MNNPAPARREENDDARDSPYASEITEAVDRSESGAGSTARSRSPIGVPRAQRWATANDEYRSAAVLVPNAGPRATGNTVLDTRGYAPTDGWPLPESRHT